MDELFACEIGTRLWHEYRRRHPEAPEIPPEALEDLRDPDATLYWLHVTACFDCNEV